MPEKYIVKLTQQAEENLREIADYIRFTLQTPGTAAKKVQVMGIVYGRRDQRHQLSGLDLF